MRVLLTGARAPVTLDLARRFSAQGHQVFLVDSLRFPIARWSRCVRKAFVVPRPIDSPRDYVASLEKLVERHDIELLVPTCEEIYYIAPFAASLQRRCQVFIDTPEKLERIHNKWSFVELARGCGAATPETHLLSSQADVEPFLQDSCQWVFKPVYSRFATHTLIGPQSQALRGLLPTVARAWVAQKRITGVEHSTYSIASSGELRAHSTYVSLYRAGKGSGIYFVRRHHEAIENFVRQFVTKVRFTGQIGFDFIVDQNDIPWVLEANPRATSGLHLFAATDPLIESIVGTNKDFVRASRNQPHMIALAMPFWGLLDAVRSRKILALLKDLPRGRDVLFQPSDPLPALLLPITMSELLFIAWRERKPLTAASTFDIEWNGEPL